MNSTEPIPRRSNDMNRLLKWPLLCGLLVLVFAGAARATDPLYQNDAIVSYPGTLSAPPVIDATTFVNNNSFTINYTTIPYPQPLFETLDTLNYTNSDNGSMVCNTGFSFDTLTTNVIPHQMAANFYNSGTISCASANDAGTLFIGLYGQFLANATNISNPGAVDVGVDGVMQFIGQNLDLTRSTLNIEGAGANQAGTGIFGLNTNFWDPSLFLGPTTAESAFFPMTPFYLALTNSTAYFQVLQRASNNIIRCVFIQDTSGSNLLYNVYFDRPDVFGNLGEGGVTIEWVGSYQDAASGNNFNSYLYLNNNYVASAATNVNFNAYGYPDNFTITPSSTQIPIGVPPTAAGYQNLFPAGSISNRYAFANVQLTSTTVSTSSIPNQAITNLPGRIQMSASKELNLAFAQITGPNYLSVQSTNQFDGSAGALIQSPYSDFNLGVTNGFPGSLTVSNLLEPQIPNWSGNIQAWSTRWLAVDATGVTNDFRVLIVGSQLNPTTLAQVQDLLLHDTNSIVISDTFNLMRTFTADAQNLTLTTNGPGNGATSLDGELNLNSSSIFWQSSVPNLRNLTNNGAVRMANQVNFGSPLAVNVTSNTPAVVATGFLSEAGTNAVKSDKVTLGTNQYVFVGTLTNTVANQVKLGTNFDSSMSNLIAAINGATGSGTAYSTATKSNLLAWAGSLTNHAFNVMAVSAGSAGNNISTLFTPAATSTNLTWSGHITLSGGADSIPSTTNVVSFPYDNFINNGLVSDQASVIYARNFVSSGVVSNGIGAFTLQSFTTTLTNGGLYAGGNIAITANSLLMSNLNLQCLSLTLTPTNFVDAGIYSSNFWTVGRTNASGGQGFAVTVKPPTGDLLGTTITNICPGPNKAILNTWPGMNYGPSASGFSNNMALGRLILSTAGSASAITFGGATGTNNALYVDYLEFRDYATNASATNSYHFPWLQINTNMMIYYAQAVINGNSVAEAIDQASRFQGANRGRLRWVPSYAGHFSSTNLVYPPGVTNTVNAALAQSTDIDSNGNGLPNRFDPAPFFLPAQVNFKLAVTNHPSRLAALNWQVPPNATNYYVQFKTNLLSANWQVLTNFVLTTNQIPSAVTNVTVLDPLDLLVPHFYRVVVQPWLSYPF